jgi:hypothetical protein
MEPRGELRVLRRAPFLKSFRDLPRFLIKACERKLVDWRGDEFLPGSGLSSNLGESDSLRQSWNSLAAAFARIQPGLFLDGLIKATL